MRPDRSAQSSTATPDPSLVLRALFEQMPHGLIVVDASGTVVSANEAAGTILGKQPVPGDRLLEARWAHQLRVGELVPRALAGETVQLEAAWLEVARSDRRDHRGAAVRVSAMPLVAGRAVGLVIDDVSSERSARDDAEARRRDEEATRSRLETIVDQMPGGVAVAEAPSGQIVLGNAQMEEILGHPILAVEGVDEYHRYGAEHPDGRPFAAEEHPLARAVAGERVEGVEVRYRRPDGDLRILTTNAAPVRAADGRVVAAVSTFYDDTQRRRVEASLRLVSEAGALLAASLDAEETVGNIVNLAVPELADLCLVFLARDGEVRRSPIAHARPELNSRFAGVWNPETPLSADHPVASVVRTGQSMLLPEISDALLQHGAKNAQHLEMLRRLDVRSAFIVPLVGHSAILGALGFGITGRGRGFDDLSRRTCEELGRRAGMALHNASLYQSAKRAVEMREQMLSIVSHDLRDPVGIVSLTASLLLRRADENGLDRRLEASALKLQTAALRMRRLIDDLLDMSSIDQGRLSISPRRVCVGELLDELVETYADQAASIGRFLEVSIDPELASRMLCCDRERMLQVLGNLVGNALEHTPVGSVVRVGGALEGVQVEISVTDEGPGIPPADQARIFDRFWQKERRGGGAGLGLFIARGIVEAHGGRIGVENVPGCGARFSFTVPLA